MKYPNTPTSTTEAIAKGGTIRIISNICSK
jgi:hypothetical protein